jgi:hypothetical protein
MKYYSLIILLISINTYGQIYESELSKKIQKEAEHYMDSFFTQSNMAKDTMIVLIKGINDMSLKKSLVGVLKLQFRCLDGKSFDQIADSLDMYSQKMGGELFFNARDRTKALIIK